MTYALRECVLCDGQPGVICGKSFHDFNVLLASGEVKANVTPDRLRPRPAIMEARAS